MRPTYESSRDAHRLSVSRPAAGPRGVDRVIRTTVGLRPHRRSGFVVRAERLDDKTLVHNYGHGGAGMSTSWGTAYQAAELAMQNDARRVAVLGCGVVGLTTARQLQRRGFDVTIYAKSVPPNTTSNMSWAGFTPTSGLLGPGGRTPAWTLQFQQAADIGYKQLQLLVGPRYGVAWINRYSGMNEVREPNPARAREDGTSGLLPADLQTGRVILQPGEHPFPTRYASCQPWLRIEPSIYLDALVSDVLMFGGRIVIRTFDTQRDLMALGEPIVVNCTGLGARDIFDDDELLPLKGQLTHFVPQPEVDYGAAAPASIGPDGQRQRGVSTNPRSDGIALGSTSERNVWSLEVNEEARRRVVEGAIALFASWGAGPRDMRTTKRIALPTAPLVVPRVEAFFGEES